MFCISFKRTEKEGFRQGRILRWGGYHRVTKGHCRGIYWREGVQRRISLGQGCAICMYASSISTETDEAQRNLVRGVKLGEEALALLRRVGTKASEGGVTLCDAQGKKPPLRGPNPRAHTQHRRVGHPGSRVLHKRRAGRASPAPTKSTGRVQSEDKRAA